MKIQAWPRSIRSQLLVGLVLLEALSLLLFAALLFRQQRDEIRERAQQRLEHQATSVAAESEEALQKGQPEMMSVAVKMMGQAPSVDSARVTDAQGRVLYFGGDTSPSVNVSSIEMAQVRRISNNEAYFFSLGSGAWEGVKPIAFNNRIWGYAWVKTEKSWDRGQLISLLRAIGLFGLIWIGASVVLAYWMARSITSPLAVLHRGTKALMQSPEGEALFPLPITIHNELGDLIEAFNRMVASIEEQRAGLSDTLSLLDSMLANAPIGLAFFDRRCRFVRVNRIFSELTGIPLSRHLGRTLSEILPGDTAHQLEKNVQEVFDTDYPLKDREITGQRDETSRPWTWITSAYPIHTTPNQVRWVGMIVMDASDRKRSEEALRKTEKLAATGRLAASIAHEINNPLEAITNLLYLLSNHSDLPEPALSYAVMAEHEVRRISEITQQTLRFYRQSTLPARANLGELLDSVLSLHHGRLRNLGITVERKYDASIDIFCFAGELRQVFANLVGNAIDAMNAGGRLVVRARRSRDWRDPQRTGVRFQVADTGSGMKEGVREHIFEPFFTTKEVTGTGLGLWVTSEIIAKHRGFIRVRSRSEALKGPSGTIFELFFPDEADLISAVEKPAEVASATI